MLRNRGLRDSGSAGRTAFFRLFESGEGFLQQTLDRAALERGEKRAMLASRFGGALSESALDVNALNIDNALNIEVFLPQDFPPEQELSLIHI